MEALRVISCSEAIALCSMDLDAPKAMWTTFSRHLPIGWLSKDKLYIFQVNILQEYDGYERNIYSSSRRWKQYRFCSKPWCSSLFTSMMFIQRKKGKCKCNTNIILFILSLLFSSIFISSYLHFYTCWRYNLQSHLYYYNYCRDLDECKKDQKYQSTMII